jgi:hypothetical protein
MKKLFFCLFVFVIILSTTTYCGGEALETFDSEKSEKQLNLDTKELYKQTVESVVALAVSNTKGGTTGTGFFALEPDIIVTCYHVVNGATSIKAKDSAGNEYKIDGIIDYSESLDIAILKSSKPGKTLTLDTNMPSPGTNVYALGNPMGFNFSFTNGMVSQIQNLDGTNVIQFSAPVSPGNSGCPLINEKGLVLGVVTYGLKSGQNLNFAVPAAMLQTLNKANKSKVFDNFKSASTSKKEEIYNKHFKLAKDLLDKKLFELAIEELTKASEYAPDNIKLIDTIEIISMIYYLDLNNYKQAKYWAEKGLKTAVSKNIQNEKVGKLYHCLGGCYYINKNYLQTIEMFNQAITLDKDDLLNSERYYNIGACYLKLGTDCHNSGNLKDDKKYCQLAITNFKKSIDLNSEFYESYKSIGKCYYLLYDNSNSKKWFDLALKHCKNEKQTKEIEEWLKKF